MRLVFPIVTSFIFIIACTTVIAQTASSQANDVTGDSIQQMRFIAEKIGLLPTLQRDEQRLRDTTKALYPLLSAKTVDSIFHSMNFETLALKSARRAFLKHFSTQEFDTLVRFFKQGFFPERSATLKKYDMSQATLMDEMANEYQKVMDYAANLATLAFYKQRERSYLFLKPNKEVEQAIVTFFTWHGEIGIVDTVSSLVKRRIAKGIADASPTLYDDITKSISLPSLFGAAFTAGMLKNFTKNEIKELASLQGDKKKMAASKAFALFQKKIQGNFVNDFNDAVNQMASYLYDACLVYQAQRRIDAMKRSLE